MKKIMPFEKPFGMKDWLPSVFRQRRKLENEIEEIIISYGYDFLSTPTLEYYETVGKSSAIKEDELFKLLDHDGNTVVLRPDMTAPIARLISTYYKDYENPVRVAYGANVFRSVGRGQKTEFRQIGIECIGDASVDAQAEVISLLSTIFKNVWKKDFQIIIGHVGLLDAWLDSYVDNKRDCKNLLQFLYEKNFIEFERYVKDLTIGAVDKRELLQLLYMKGSVSELITKLYKRQNREIKNFATDLEELFQLITLYGVEQHVTFDLSFVPHISYYTGIVFEVYGEGKGEVLAGGGQYDELYDQFDKNVAAIGFGITLDSLLEVTTDSNYQKDAIAIFYEKKYVTKALEEAKKMRAKNKIVCLQNIETIENIDEYMKNYKIIIYMREKEEEK